VLSGTIIFAVQRPGFVVLATDRLSTGWDEGTGKMVWHKGDMPADGHFGSPRYHPRGPGRGRVEWSIG
jgi:hypothetical protein